MDCTSVVAVLLKCSTIYCLQNFVKYNSWEKLKHILKKPWGTIRMDSEMEDL